MFLDACVFYVENTRIKTTPVTHRNSITIWKTLNFQFMGFCVLIIVKVTTKRVFLFG